MFNNRKIVYTLISVSLFVFMIIPPGSGYAPIYIEERSGKNLYNYEIMLNLSHRNGMNPDFSNLEFLYPIEIYELPVQIISNETLQDYQVKIEITNETILSHMRGDAGDIRVFYNKTSNPYSETSGKIPYWIELKNETFLRLWIKVNLSEGMNKVYMYYGNYSTPSESNGSETFIFFDDFDTLDGWNLVGGRFGFPQIIIKDNKTVLELGDNEGIFRELDVPENFSIEFLNYINERSIIFISVTDKSYQNSTTENGYGFFRKYKMTGIVKGVSGSWPWRGGYTLDEEFAETPIYTWIRTAARKLGDEFFYNIGGIMTLYGKDRVNLLSSFNFIDIRNGVEPVAFVDWIFVRNYTYYDPYIVNTGVESIPRYRVSSIRLISPYLNQFINTTNISIQFKVISDAASALCKVSLNNRIVFFWVG